MQRASGGFGSLVIMNRNIIPIPFNTPDGDIVIMIGDWYTQNHTVGFLIFYHALNCEMRNFLILIMYGNAGSKESP